MTLEPVQLASALWSMAEASTFVDIEFHCQNGETVMAHKAVISFRLPFFTNIFEDHQIYDDVLCVHLPDINAQDLKDELQTLYLTNLSSPILDKVVGEASPEPLALPKSSPNSAQSLPQPATMTTPFKCQHCDKTYKKKKELYTHVLVHFPEKWKFQCPKCPEKFMTSRLLRTHMAKNHDARIVCQICDKTYSTDANLAAHMKNVHHQEEIPCEYCGQTLKSKAYLAIHLKKHLKEGADFEVRACQTCGKTFKGRYYYQHVKMHEPSQWKHKCRYCGQRFQNKYKRIEHEAVSHTGAKQFPCQVCGKTFHTTSRRASHKKVCQGSSGSLLPPEQEAKDVPSKSLPLVLPHLKSHDA